MLKVSPLWGSLRRRVGDVPALPPSKENLQENTAEDLGRQRRRGAARESRPVDYEGSPSSSKETSRARKKQEEAVLRHGLEVMVH